MPARGKRGESSDSASDSSSDDRHKRQSKSKPVQDSSDSGSSSGESSDDSTPPKRHPQRKPVASTSQRNRNDKASPPHAMSRRRPPSPKNASRPTGSRQSKNSEARPSSKRHSSARSRSPKVVVRGPRTPSQSPPKIKKEPSLTREQTVRHKRSRSPKDKQRRTRSPKTHVSPPKSKSASSAKSPPRRPRGGARPTSPIPIKPESRVRKDTNSTNSSDNESPQKRRRNDSESGLVATAPRNRGPHSPQGPSERDLRGGFGEQPNRPHSMSRFESESENEAPNARQKDIRGLKSSVQRPGSPGHGKRRRMHSGDDPRDSPSEGELSDHERPYPQPGRRGLEGSPKRSWARYSERSPPPEEGPGPSGGHWSHDYGGRQRYSPPPGEHAYDHPMNRQIRPEPHLYPPDSREFRRHMESDERAWRPHDRSSPRPLLADPLQRYPELDYRYEDDLQERQRHEEEWDRYYRENGQYGHWPREDNPSWRMPPGNFPDRRNEDYPGTHEPWQNHSERPHQSERSEWQRDIYQRRQERRRLLKTRRMQDSNRPRPSSYEPEAGERNHRSQTSAEHNNTSRDDQRNASKGDQDRHHNRNNSRTGQGDTDLEQVPQDQSPSRPSNQNQSRKLDEKNDRHSRDRNPRNNDRPSHERDPLQRDENKEQEDLSKVSRDSRKRNSMESDRNTNNGKNKENVSTAKDESKASKKPRDRENISGSPAPKKPRDRENISGSPAPKKPRDRENISGSPAPKKAKTATDSPNTHPARNNDADKIDRSLTANDRSNVPASAKPDAGRSSGATRKTKDGTAPDGPTTTASTGADILTGRTGGAYIPPAKLRMMQAQITDKSSVAYQRLAWEALKKSINGLVNKVNISNMPDIARELFHENIVRGRGMLSRSVLQAQAASLTFTHVYAAMAAIINTKFPQIGELILKRLIIQFRRGFKRNNKELCLSSTTFIAHLVNQQVAHEVLALEILTLLLEEPSEDSVEIAVGFLKASGQKLTEVSPRGSNAIFERLRNILHEGQIDKRIQYMIEVVMAIRKDGFKDFVAVLDKLDLVEEAEQFTHLMTLDVDGNEENGLNVFKADPDYLENEEKYATLKKDILDESSSDGEGESGSEESDDDDEDEEAKQTIIDSTETNLVMLRRTIYLTIQSSLDFEECAHKLLKMELKPGQEVELCSMILDCCAQQRTYEKFYGLLAQRFCQIDKKYVEPYQNIFKEQYDTIHRLETNKLRNVAKFFGHLLHSDGISWGVLSCIKLNEEDTTSASRIFVKILFQELSEFMGLAKLNERLTDKTLQVYFEGILPRDNPNNTRFAINFFTTIGLGGLTDDLREHLKGVSKEIQQQKIKEQLQQQEQKTVPAAAPASSSSAASSSSSDSSSSESGGSSGSESDSESSDSDADKKKKKKKKLRKVKPHSPAKPRKNGHDKVKSSERTDKKNKSLGGSAEKAKKKHDSNENISEKSRRKDDRRKNLPEDVRRNEPFDDRPRDAAREGDGNVLDNRDHYRSDDNINHPDRPLSGERGYPNDHRFPGHGDDRERRFNDERNMDFDNGRDRMRQGYGNDRDGEFRRNRGGYPGRQDGFRNFNNQRGGRSQQNRRRQNRQRTMSGQKNLNRRNQGGRRNTPRKRQ